MSENNLILSDQIEGYPHPKVTETLFGHHVAVNYGSATSKKVI